PRSAQRHGSHERRGIHLQHRLHAASDHHRPSHRGRGRGSSGSMKRGLVVLVAVGCVPALTSTDSLVSVPRILAVRAEPAEAKPGTTVMFEALVAAPPGASAGSPSWSFCVAPKPLTEDNIVSDACLGSHALRAAGSGATLAAPTPSNGCSLFGP